MLTSMAGLSQGSVALPATALTEFLSNLALVNLQQLREIETSLLHFESELILKNRGYNVVNLDFIGDGLTLVGPR